MKITFTEKNRDRILQLIKDAMSGRKLADIVGFALKPGKLEVSISKMGTSVLTFEEKQIETGLQYSLTSEKIAFTHKPFKDEVSSKILQVIKAAGGTVVV